MNPSHGIVSAIIKRTCDEVTCSGIEHLTAHPRTLYISNHSDIVREPALINYVLAQHGLPLAHIGAGKNLFMIPLLWPILALQPGVLGAARQERRQTHR
jgi:hypothetical protein